ncbi:MAG TPA: uroporphyrinogen-III synthase [Flavitalea sp.]|nr:uroporphyrinogen-III synthase [Flavitalea sp.]
MSPFRILFTKKLKRSYPAFAEKYGVEFTELPFIRIEAFADHDRQVEEITHDAVLVFTSVNAVTFFVGQHKALEGFRLYTLDGSTRQEAEKYFQKGQLLGTATNSTMLARLIVRERKTEEVFFICGNLRRNELPEMLKKAGIRVTEIIVYQTTLVPQAMAEQFDGVAFFSPSAVESFFISNHPGPATIYFSIGSTTSRALRGYTGNTIITAGTSSEESLLEALEIYLVGKNESDEQFKK